MDGPVERMIACGIPENTAKEVYRDFVKRGKISTLFAYVDEEESARRLERGEKPCLGTRIQEEWN